MPAYWDPKESKETLYNRVHKHDSGMFSFTMEPPFRKPGENDPAIHQKLQELKEAVERGKSRPEQPSS